MDRPPESEFQQRRRYNAWRDNHPVIPITQLKSWEEMSEDDRAQWAEKNPPVSPTDADIVAAGKEWIESQVASLTPEQRQAAAIFFHGPKIGGPPPERFFERLGLAVISQPQWGEAYPDLVEVYAKAINTKLYQ